MKNTTLRVTTNVMRINKTNKSKQIQRRKTAIHNKSQNLKINMRDKHKLFLQQ